MWIITVWQCISPRACEGFSGVLYGISNAVDETDDKKRNRSEENGNVRSECEEDEGTDCEGGEKDTD
jgi:hypothetical protein